MRQMTTQVHSAEPKPGLPANSNFNQAARVREAMQKSLDNIRSKSTVEIGVVSNFDPDQRGFVTGALQGYAMLQKQVGASTVGVLAVNADYGRVPPGQKQAMHVLPGQPQVIYPVGSGGGSSSLSFIKGGKIDYKRAYPTKLLTRNQRAFFFGGDGPRVSENHFGTTNHVVYTNFEALDAFLPGVSLEDLSWSENSPLPPGLRYQEIEKLAADAFGTIPTGLSIDRILQGNDPDQPPLTLDELRIQLLQFPGDEFFTDFDSYLPHDSQGRIRTNPKPAPLNSFYHLGEVLGDDSYWTGEVKDPLNWKDDYWDGLDRDPTGNSPRVNREGMATWLEAHPAARYY